MGAEGDGEGSWHLTDALPTSSSSSSHLLNGNEKILSVVAPNHAFVQQVVPKFPDEEKGLVVSRLVGRASKRWSRK